MSTFLVEQLEKMIEIRCVEELLLELFSQGKISGTTHTSIGQEAIAVGLSNLIDITTDYVFSNHRCHGHFLSLTRNPANFFAEILGVSGALCNGMGGSQHLHFKNFYSNGVQGGVPAVAAGLALGQKLLQNTGITVCFIGDGTFGEGIVYEILNIASLWKLPLLIIVEDNGISQSTPQEFNRAGRLEDRFRAFNINVAMGNGQSFREVTSLVEQSIGALRAHEGPQAIIFKTHRFMSHSKGDDHRPPHYLQQIRNEDPIDILVQDLTCQNIFVDKEALLKRYKLQIRQIYESLEKRDKISCTQHQLVESFAPSSPPPEFALTVAKELNQSLHSLLEHDPAVVLIGEDIADPYGGAFKITAGLSTKFPRQIFTSPISEAGIVAIANGLALCGLKPIVEIMFGDFLLLAADQILNHAAKFQAMYALDSNFNLVIRTPMGGRRGYGPTHSQTIEKHLMGIPGLTIVAINSLSSPARLLKWSIDHNGPVLFIENKSLYAKKFEGDKISHFSLNTLWEKDQTALSIYRSSDVGTCDIVLTGYGGISSLMVEAAAALLAEEIYCTVVVPERVDPMGELYVNQLVTLNKPILIVEESSVNFSWSSELISQLIEGGRCHSVVKRIGSFHTIIPASRTLEDGVLIQSGDIVSAVLKMLS